jgi:putative membrane protein
MYIFKSLLFVATLPISGVLSAADGTNPALAPQQIMQTKQNPWRLEQNDSHQHVHQSIQKFRSNLEHLKNLPISALTTPCWLLSKDSSFTKSWSFEDWEMHQEQSAKRYARHLISWFVSTTAYNIMPTIFLVAGWTILLFKLTDSRSLNLSAAKFVMTLGFIQSPILLLLTLKTNRSLDRMLEARKAWGKLTRATRSLVGLICAHVIPQNPEVGLLMARYLALIGWSLKAAFRRNEDEAALISTVFENYPEEKEWLLNCPTKRPLGIITRLRYLLAGMQSNEKEYSTKGSAPEQVLIAPVILLRMDQILYDIEQTIGINTRIFVSPVPPTYTRHTSRVLVLYMFLMPGALVGSGVSLLPAIITATFASYVLVGIDEIGLEIEYPFHLLPMYSLSKNILNEVEKQVIMLEQMLSMPRN